MIKKNLFKNNNHMGLRAQAIVEFAIVLPILIMILVGLLEVGRLIFIYSAATNSSREAARYGSAVGLGDDGLHKYNNCAGIRDVAKSSAFLLDLPDANIAISYDHGPGTGSPFVVCDAVSGEDADVVVSSGDRVLVTVTAPYSPMVKLIPITPRTFILESARTIFGIVELDP